MSKQQWLNEWPHNEWIAIALNLVNNTSGKYSASYYGIRVSITGGDGYTISNNDAIEQLEKRVKVIEQELPIIKENLNAYHRMLVQDALEGLSECQGDLVKV